MIWKSSKYSLTVLQLRRRTRSLLLVLSLLRQLFRLAASAEGETASSSGLSDYATQITAQFTDTANDIIPIIVGVLGAGLGVFAIFLGIRLAKKMFSTVSK